MAPVQQSLFAEEEVPRNPYVPDPDLSRNKLLFMLNLMRSASNWPWDQSSVQFFRETLWPQAYAALDIKEAAKFRAEIEAESARLNAAQ